MDREYQTESQHNKKILTTLFKDYEHSFSSLQRKTGISPRLLKKCLVTLKDKGIVTEEIDKQRWKNFSLEEMSAKSSKWKKRGNIDNRPKIIRISDKGKKNFLKLVMSDVNQSLRDMANLLSELCVDKERLRDWETTEEEIALNETFLAKKKDSGGFQKAFQEYNRRSLSRSAPLDEACKNLHLIRCIRYRVSTDTDKFITVIKGQEVLPPIRTQDLEDIDFHARFFGLKNWKNLNS
jgi:hypothetical protein